MPKNSRRKLKPGVSKIKTKLKGKKKCPAGVDPTELAEDDENFGRKPVKKKCPKDVDPADIDDPEDENYGCKISLLTKIGKAASKIDTNKIGSSISALAEGGLQAAVAAPGLIENARNTVKNIDKAIKGEPLGG